MGFCPYEGEALGLGEMKDYNFVSRQVEGSIACNNYEFGDPTPGHPKACFCEPDNRPQVKRCAADGGDCTCRGGNVFYGLLEVDGATPASFEEMWTNAFAVKYDVSGTVGCNARTFGLDPQPGKAKQCFCDDIGFEDYECIESELAYWAEQREVTRIQYEAETQYSESYSSVITTTTVSEETQRRI